MASTIAAGTTSGTAIAIAGDTSGVLQLQTNGTTAAVTIDTSQNVGIGTSSPTKLLSVFKTQNAETSILVRNESTDTAGKAIIRFGNSNSDDVGSVGALSSGFTPSGALEADGFYVDAGRQSLNLSASNNGIIKFYGAGNERMRIDSSGRLLVNLNGTLGGMINSYGTSASAAYYGKVFVNGDFVFGVQNSSGTVVGGIVANASTTSYNTSSDYRLKENIAPMTGALAKVAQLKPCTYTWKEDGTDGQGFIAHELQEVISDCVSGEKDAVNADGSIKPQGVDTSFLVATLTAAIQELKATVDAQAVRIAELEGAK